MPLEGPAQRWAQVSGPLRAGVRWRVGFLPECHCLLPTLSGPWFPVATSPPTSPVLTTPSLSQE